MKTHAHKIPTSPPQVQRLAAVLPAHRLLLLVPSQPYGSEGIEPVDMTRRPYYQQYQSAVSCVSGSGGSLCGGFHGTTGEGEALCGWLPRALLPDQVLTRALAPGEDHPDPWRRHVGRN